MRRREACAALAATLGMPAFAAPDDGALPAALAIARRYTAPPAPHYAAALLISAQRRLAAPAQAPDLARAARAATQGLRDAMGEPGQALPTDWPRLAGYAALAEAATQDGDTAAGALAVKALRSVLTDTAHGPRLSGLRPWTDDLFLATLLLDRTAPLLPAPERARAAAALGATLQGLTELLQRPDGLFNHAEGSPVAWGRGNGFAALGLALALAGPLQASGAAAPPRTSLQRHLLALLPLQGPDGLWRQVLDHDGATPELTVTAMNLAALATARRHGWLPARTTDAAITRAWAGVRSRIDAEGGFQDVCAGTPAGPTLDFYLQRPILHGRDERAAAMVLTAALSLG